ncbi:MAG: nitroreductase family protein [Chloroflexota bacterium]
MATALGLGTCWIGAIDVAGLNKYFNLPENITTLIVLTVGYPAEPIPKQRPRLKMEEILLKPLPKRAGSGASV